MQDDLLKTHSNLDPRSNFEVDLLKLSPASVSVSPLLMWFDACLLLQKHPQAAAE